MSPIRPVTQVLLASLVSMYLWNYWHKNDWTDYCIRLNVVPSLLDVALKQVFLHLFSVHSALRLFCMMVMTHVVGVCLESTLGSVRYAIYLTSANLVIGYISLSTGICQCFTSEALGPTFSALAVLVHSLNPRVFPDTVRRAIRVDRPIELRWLLWLLLFVYSLHATYLVLPQYLVGIAVGLIFLLLTNPRARVRFVTLVSQKYMRLLRALSIYFATCVFSLSYTASPNSVSLILSPGTGSLLSRSTDVAADQLSWLLIRLMLLLPLASLSDTTAHILDYRAILILPILAYITNSPVLVFPHLGFISLCLLLV